MRPRPGFTLVELLVATGLFTVVAGGMYGATAAGVRAWAQAQDAVTTLPAVTTCLEHLATQLRSSFVFPDVAWTSGEGSLAFVTAEQGIFPVFVTYHRTPEGHLVEHAVALGDQAVRDHQWLPHVRVFTLHYAYVTEEGALAWEPRWTDRERPPRIVRIALTTGASSASARTLTKTVLIPIGVLGTYERGGRA